MRPRHLLAAVLAAGALYLSQHHRTKDRPMPPKLRYAVDTSDGYKTHRYDAPTPQAAKDLAWAEAAVFGNQSRAVAIAPFGVRTIERYRPELIPAGVEPEARP